MVWYVGVMVIQFWYNILFDIVVDIQWYSFISYEFQYFGYAVEGQECFDGSIIIFNCGIGGAYEGFDDYD